MNQDGILNFKKNLDRLALIVLVGYLCNTFYAYAMSHIFKKGYPFDTFLCNPNYIFTDFFNHVRISADLNPYHNEGSNYFPFGVLIAYPFSFLMRKVSLFTFFTISLAIYGYWIRDLYLDYSKKVKDPFDIILPFIILFTLSYPFLFAVDRANFEIFIFFFLMFFLYNYKKHPYLSSLSLAAAIAMKLSPAVFIFLYLSEKKYKQAAITTGFTVLLTLLSILSFKGDIMTNIHGMFALQESYVKLYAVGNFGYEFSHSFFTFIKFVLYTIGAESLIGLALKFYVLIILGLFGGLVFLLLKKNFTFFGKLSLLTLAMISFPNVSADYRLIHVFLIIFMLLKENQLFISNKLYDYLIISLGLLLIPKSYHLVGEQLSLGMILNPLLLLFLMFMILKNELSLWKNRI